MKESTTPKPALLTPKQLAAVLALKTRTVYGLARRGEIPTVRVGRTIRFHLETIIATLQTQQPLATATRPKRKARNQKKD